jgi:hypothetical protein
MATKPKSGTVSFNVGGTDYEVSWSLLDSFPGTMLHKIAIEREETGSSDPIFIDRDG